MNRARRRLTSVIEQISMSERRIPYNPYIFRIVVPFVRRCLRRRRRTHSFGHYTNMVQQIKFIIHTNIQPLPALFFTQGQGHRSKVKVKDLKKILLTQ